MGTSSNISDNAYASILIKINGSPIPDLVSVLSVHIDKKVNRISSAKIVILDGDVTSGNFDISSSSTFISGSEIIIEAGYGTGNHMIFKGIITSQSVRVDSVTGSVLEIGCRDIAVKMTVGRKSATYTNEKDSEIMTSILSAYPGLSSTVTPTITSPTQRVQYYVTDWDYILSLAENNGLVVTNINGLVTVTPPDHNTASVLYVAHGVNLLEFDAKLNSLTQLGHVSASGWDYKNQSVTAAEATSDGMQAGNLSSKQLSELIGLPPFELQTPAPLEDIDLDNWCKAQITKSECSKITGTAKFQGTHLAEPGNYMTFAGLGTRFNGDYLISGVVHSLLDGNWTTEVSLGLSAQWLAGMSDVSAPPASGLTPAATGLFNGTVVKVSEDPDSQYRILVSIPQFGKYGDGIWARISNFYATQGAGAFFSPEIGDEVIVGFVNEDPRFPIILGSLYSSKNVKPFGSSESDADNSVKGIVSRSGIIIAFDDENKIWTVATPNQNTIIISDLDKKITIQDENQNEIVMSANGIDLSSQKNINISAMQNVTLTGGQGVNITSEAGNVITTAVNIEDNANMDYNMEAGRNVDVQSQLQLTLKGATVKIN
jgi:Rhs element Vgr protein